MLLSFFNLNTCALIYDISWHGQCINKEHIWPTVLTWFLRSQNAQKYKFSGAPPPTPLGELTQRTSLLPRPPIAGGKGTWVDAHPVLGPSIRPRSYVSGFNPLRSCLLSIVHVNMIFILLIHNNAYSFLLNVLHFNLKRSQLTIYIVTPSRPKAHMGVGAQSTFAGQGIFALYVW